MGGVSGEGGEGVSSVMGGQFFMFVFTWRNRRLPSSTRINSSVCPSVHACRLGIERKMAQAQQMSIILKNHEHKNQENRMPRFLHPRAASVFGGLRKSLVEVGEKAKS